MSKHFAFYFNSEVCNGCKSCMIACTDKHNNPLGVQWRRVLEYSGGEWMPKDDTYEQNVFAYYVSISCNHCENPLCVKACPTKAMHQLPNGIVAVDQTRCVGCRYCEWNCPYGAPQFNPVLKRMSKCDFCQDYLAQGLPPACVAACPCRALDYGEYEELKEKYGTFAPIAPLPRPELTTPRFICAPNRHAKPQGSTEGIRGTLISNPEEV